MDFKNKLILAPLEGVTCMPYRMLCKKYGADIVISEMVNANAIISAAKNLRTKLLIHESERPVGIQIAAPDKESAVKAVKIIDNSVDFININMGCPSRLIMGSGCGAALLSQPKKIGEMVKAVVKCTDLPVTVKIRADNALRNCKIIEDNGAEAIAIHLRTIDQKGAGKPDLKLLKEIKAAVNIPIIGNGGVNSIETAREMLNICDSIMIGTAAMGNPAIFNLIKHGLKNEKYEMPSGPKQFLEFYELTKKYDFTDFVWLKSMSMYFTNGISGASRIRVKISSSKSIEEILLIFEELAKKA